MVVQMPIHRRQQDPNPGNGLHLAQVNYNPLIAIVLASASTTICKEHGQLAIAQPRKLLIHWNE